jgi:RimJ/RimL family protein N-acetyltransferase
MKVKIRQIRNSDASISYKWRNDPDVWKYTFNRPNIVVTPKIERQWVESVLKTPNRKTFAICVGKSEKYVGNVQLLDITDKSGELGIFIGEKRYWGKGIGRKAIKLIVSFAKNVLKLESMFLSVKKDNITAVKCYEHCGFKQIGMLNDTDIRMKLNLK